MALEIKIIDCVFCIKGKVSTNRLSELKNYFTAALQFENRVVVNLCQVNEGRNSLMMALQKIKNGLQEGKILQFYGTPEAKLSKPYHEINSPANYYQAA